MHLGCPENYEVFTLLWGLDNFLHRQILRRVRSARLDPTHWPTESGRVGRYVDLAFICSTSAAFGQLDDVCHQVDLQPVR